MQDDRTPNYSMPLPSSSNMLQDDVQRLREALTMLDTALAKMPTEDSVKAALAALVDGAPGALDTLRELATAIGNDPAFATTVSGQISSLMNISSALIQQINIYSQLVYAAL